MRVHSVASTAASPSPSIALSSVDLPAFTRPAMATSSGPCMRAADLVDALRDLGDARRSAGGGEQVVDRRDQDVIH